MYNHEVSDDWAGFDSSPQLYDEKKEKRYQARIWWCLFVPMVLCFCCIVVWQIKDAAAANTKKHVKAEFYDAARTQVRYITEQGYLYIYRLPGYSVRMEDGCVLLYYTDDVRFAKPIPDFKSWIPYYAAFLVLISLCGWRLWRIYYGKRRKR